ncbi:MAG: DUF1800 family protein [Verrucomicrobiota bacterium]|nr:DUF1800 family protein [Verrucomicrobiota bacterium]
MNLKFHARLVVAAIFAATLTAAPLARAVSREASISTRGLVQAGDNVMIGGFIVAGTGTKKIVIRAIGPSLPVPGTLADPVVELHGGSGVIASNDNWRSSQGAELIALNLAPADDRESALVVSLTTGAYTVIVRGVNNTSGVALVQIYDLDGPDSPARLSAISTRGNVLTGDNVMIGGFIISGDVPKKMLMRVLGPSLYANGVPVPGALLDPVIELHDSNGAILAQNDNWRSTQEAEINASTLAPLDEREAVVVATLPPGAYTAIARGARGTSGIALIDVYDLDQPPQADGSTLYISQLRAQSGTASLGSGVATMRLAADEKSAVVTFRYSNLSGPLSAAHVHASDGSILFDLDSATPQPDGTYIWTFVAVGSRSVADIIALIKAGGTYLNLHTANFPTGEIKGFFNLSTGGQTAPTPTPPPALPGGTPTATDAARFVSQSSFGATDALIAQVQSQGFDTFLNNQFAAPASSHLAIVDAEFAALPSPSPSATPNQPSLTMTNDAWWTRAVAAGDQLRQRVAFALSELFVVSTNSAGLGNKPFALPAYYDVLVRDAFANYRQLLEDVTLNPAMGAYLDMLENDKGDPSAGRLPNENYAREIMQLFSIGLYQLNLDGSLTLTSNGFPIATYQQDAVLGTAAAFTGWTFAQTGTPVFKPGAARQDWRVPMINLASHHDTGAKTILNHVLLPANQSAAQDLQTTLDTIFNHPNVGPFIARQLIERLVTSNPSPGYVYRVASVFNNNGRGVRGDLQAVVRAILMDYDARTVKTGQGAGKEREPVLRVTNLLRAFGASSASGVFSVRGAYAALNEEAMHSPTVFNFFTPDYSAPGAIAAAGLTSPEFEITTETTVVTTANFLRNAIYSYLGPNADRITLNLANEISLASNPPSLVDHLNSLFLAGNMSDGMRNVLLNAINQIPANNPTERARTAIYLVINSPEFAIER